MRNLSSINETKNSQAIKIAHKEANSPTMKIDQECTNPAAFVKTDESENDISDDQLEFSIFCIENVAEKLGMKGDEVYQLLTTEENNILSHYIIPCYEILHTQSKEYIVNDIIEYMQDEGVLK